MSHVKYRCEMCDKPLRVDQVRYVESGTLGNWMHPGPYCESCQTRLLTKPRAAEVQPDNLSCRSVQRRLAVQRGEPIPTFNPADGESKP